MHGTELALAEIWVFYHAFRWLDILLAHWSALLKGIFNFSLDCCFGVFYVAFLLFHCRFRRFRLREHWLSWGWFLDVHTRAFEGNKILLLFATFTVRQKILFGSMIIRRLHDFSHRDASKSGDCPWPSWGQRNGFVVGSICELSKAWLSFESLAFLIAITDAYLSF